MRSKLREISASASEIEPLRGFGRSREQRARVSALAVAALICALDASAAAAPERAGPPSRPATTPPEHDPPLPEGEEPRDEPDYDGRGDEHADAGDALLWVPRVALFPLYVVSEYAIRTPVGALFTVVERHQLAQKYQEFFTFGERDEFGIFPTGTIDLGFRPTFGFYSYWQSAEKDTAVKLRATTGGLDSWTVNVLFRIPLGRSDGLRVTSDISRRPDKAFFGLGPEGRDDSARYRERRFQGRVLYAFGRKEVSFSAYMGVLSVSFDPGHRDLGDPSLAEAITMGVFTTPPGLEDGVLALQSGLSARFDTRSPRVTPTPRTIADLEHRSGTGIAIGAHVEHDAGLKETRATPEDEARIPQWLRYGAGISGALDVTGTRRTIELETLVELAQALPPGNPIPFSEQVRLGGEYPLRAFRSGRLMDESAAVSTLTYRWPIWEMLDGHLHYAVGNVFSERLGNFAFDRLRSSFGMGISSAGSLDHPFEIILALGTKPFREGSAVDSVRFVFGTRARF